MVEIFNNTSLDKVNEGVVGFTSKFNDLKKNIIDENLDKLTIGDTLSDMLLKVNKTLNIDLFGLGTASSLLGIKAFDIEKYKKKGGIWNIIFKKYGGVEGLHKTYIEKTLQIVFTDQPEKQKAVTDLYVAYQKDKQTNILSDVIGDSNSLNVACGLGFNTTTPTTILEKLPPVGFSYLTEKITSTLSGNEQYLDPNILSLAGYSAPSLVGAQGTKIIDTTSPHWDPKKIDKNIIEKYIALKTKEFVDNPGFMKNIQSSDHFVLSLIGGLFIGGNVFENAVLIGVKQPSDFGLVVPLIQKQEPDGNIEKKYGNINFSKANFNQQQLKNIHYLITEMEKQGITNPNTQIGILSVIGKECLFVPQSEVSYANTNNKRIRSIFGARISVSDKELNEIKKDDLLFFDMIYGKNATKKLGWETGNTEVGDGYKYRGRGFNQITFKNTYEQYKKLLGVDIVAQPDLLNTPEVAAKAAILFLTKGASLPKFEDKESSTRHFADKNAGGRGGYRKEALEMSKNFDVETLA